MTNKPYDPYPWSLRSVAELNYYEVPVYQRPYTWGEQQVKTLLDDLFVGYEKNKTNKDDVFFTGTLFLRQVCKSRDGNHLKYEVVDGQQRLTTFSMILLSIY